MHCHMEIDQIEGMAMIIEEGEQDEWPAYPDNFPKCGSFKYSSAEPGLSTGTFLKAKISLVYVRTQNKKILNNTNWHN